MIKLPSTLTTIMFLLTISFSILNGSQHSVQNLPIQQEIDTQVTSFKSQQTATEIQSTSEVENIFDGESSSLQASGRHDIQQWIILTPDQPWAAEELGVISDILTTVIRSLNDQGLDGRALLSNYRFRRQHGEYIVGHEGRIAVVNHEEQVITLADAAFKRLHGFYIIHELGHVVDERTSRQLTSKFHNLAGTDLDSGQTAEGYWLNLHGRDDLEEAAADAFALWILKEYDPDYKPVFAHTPPSTKYERIQALLTGSLGSIERPQ